VQKGHFDSAEDEKVEYALKQFRLVAGWFIWHT
jgi:hypothetical protein